MWMYFQAYLGREAAKKCSIAACHNDTIVMQVIQQRQGIASPLQAARRPSRPVAVRCENAGSYIALTLMHSHPKGHLPLTRFRLRLLRRQQHAAQQHQPAAQQKTATQCCDGGAAAAMPALGGGAASSGSGNRRWGSSLPHT
jgi:hypothetical protein